MYYLGIDPGACGALAFFDPDRDAMNVYDMPTHTVRTGGKNRQRIDMHELANIVKYYAPRGVRGMIEEVSALPGQGVTSMFSFGKAAGAVEMALAALCIPYELVTPAVWKRVMNVRGDKDEARRQASRLMPAHAKHWPLKKHDGRAEAALLAYYSWQKNARQEPRLKLEEML